MGQLHYYFWVGTKGLTLLWLD